MRRKVIVMLLWLVAALTLATGLLHVESRFVQRDTVDNLVNTVVLVQVSEGHGSGVYLGNGQVLTAAHVAKSAPGGVVSVVFKKSTYSARVVWFDENTDTALLTIQPHIVGMAAARLVCSMPDVKVGDAVTAIGNPLQLVNMQTWGRVGGFTNYNFGETDKPEVKAIVADMTLAPGNSGGPAFSHGVLAGITNALLAQGGIIGGHLFAETLIIPRSVICHQLVSKHPEPKFEN